MKQAFMECAVRVVARDGMEKATTKAIAAEAKLNEAYIYKCFSNKGELLSAALHMEDVRLANLLQKRFLLCICRICRGRSGRISSGKEAGILFCKGLRIVLFTLATIIPQATVPMPMKGTLRASNR